MSSEGWEEEFRRNEPLFRDLASNLKEELTRVCKSQKIRTVAVEARAKDFESLQEKVVNRGKAYRNLTDLVGVRIITPDLQSCEAAAAAVVGLFEIDWDNSVDKASTYDVATFGYLSQHFIANLKPGHLRTPTWTRFGTIKFEIQVRTALQHAYAAFSHEIDYKSRGQSRLPFPIRRDLFRIAAILEGVDREFLQIGGGARTMPPTGDFQMLPSRLRKLADSVVFSSAVQERVSLAISAGFREDKTVGGWVDSLRHLRAPDRIDWSSVPASFADGMNLLDRLLSSDARLSEAGLSEALSLRRAEEEVLYRKLVKVFGETAPPPTADPIDVTIFAALTNASAGIGDHAAESVLQSYLPELATCLRERRKRLAPS